MKNSLKENPEIVPAPQFNPMEPTPQTNPIKPILPEIAPNIKKVEPTPVFPEIKPFIQPDIKQM